jgi:hypothetical protein
MILDPIPSDVANYIKTLCEKHKDIRHSDKHKMFYRDAEEFTGNNRKNFSIVMVNHPGSYSDVGDNLQINYHFELRIIAKPDNDSTESRLLIKDKCQRIAHEFVKKIYTDAGYASDESTWQFIGFNINSVSFQELDFLQFDGAWGGWSITVPISAPAPIDVDESKWL